MQFLDTEAAESDISDTEFDLLVEPREHQQPVKKPRWSGKRFLVTYAQCLEDPNDVFAKLDAKRSIARAVGATELHEDGNQHIHIAVEFEVKLNTYDCRWFDYQYGPDCQVYHPNFSAAKSWPRCINYCRGKEKKLVDLFQWRCTFQEALDTHTAAACAKSKPDLYEACRAVYPDREKWHQWCYENGAALFMREVWSVVDKPPILQSITKPLAFGPDSGCVDVRFQFLQLPADFTKPVVVIGPSGAGKTTWAINSMLARFGQGMSVCQTDDLRLLDFRVDKFVIFDEIRFNGDAVSGKGAWPLEKQVAICDTALARAVHCRYGNAVLPAGFPRIFTAAERMPFVDNFQIRRRIHIINLYPEDYNIWF